MQLTVPETHDYTRNEQRLMGKQTCIGWYQEVRLLPVSMKVSVNMTNCYASFFSWIFMGGDLEYGCNFMDDKRITSEKVLLWEGWRMTLPIFSTCF